MKWLPIVPLILLLGPGPILAGSFNRLPNPPAAKPVPADSTQEASPPAAMAESVTATKSESAPKAAETETPGAAKNQAEAQTDAVEVEVVPEGEPTYGEACIYGPRGVVHAPTGRDCEAEQTRRELEVSEAKPASGGVGRCIFGAHGEVVYAPPGASCEGKVRTQERSPVKTRPRVRRYRPGR